jgi:hypothetical protein
LNGARYSNPTENTLSNIEDARAKIEDLKSKVDGMRNIKSTSRTAEEYERKETIYNQELDEHLEKTAESIRSRMKRGEQVPLSRSENIRENNTVNQIHKQDSPVRSFNSPLHNQKQESPIRSFTSPQHSQKQESPIRSNQDDKQSEAGKSPIKPFQFARTLSPQRMPPLKPKNAFLAQDEINRLKMEIENEREIRRGKESEREPKSSSPPENLEQNDAGLIKKKLLERLRLDSKQKNADNAIPAWTTRSKLATNSGNFHVRRRAPIDVPGVLGDNEDNGKREMPFIVGRVNDY